MFPKCLFNVLQMHPNMFPKCVKHVLNMQPKIVKIASKMQLNAFETHKECDQECSQCILNALEKCSKHMLKIIITQIMIPLDIYFI